MNKKSIIPKTITIKCACGRKIPQRFNSTIQNKQCPKCTLLNLTSGDDKAVKKGLYDKKTTKSTGGRKKSSKSLAMDNADLWFSRYIRIKYSFQIQDGDVFCRCIVNPSIIKHAKHLDNGHYFSRGFQATRYSENNCRPQNRSSNRFSGEMDHPKFGDNLSEQIGKEAFDELNLMYRQLTMVSEEYFKEVANKYRNLVNELVKEHSIKKWW